ncbi:MAG: DUF1015 domain-containing protein [Gammaproteobacteria bacterium]|nr:DUF1015 domain-containing protein [Gammaproteobacteria bacterium]
MSLIRPFTGLRPVPERAADVAAPPYDVLNTEEARQRAAGKPWSFLHISKPEIDLPAGTDPYAPVVYAKAVENLHKMEKEGILWRDAKPYYYLYRLQMGEHVQTGLVAAASVAAYDAERIRRHEFTRPDKEDDRVRQIAALNAQTGPVFLTYRHSPVIDALAGRVASDAPEYDFSADDGVRHALWVVRDEVLIRQLGEAFENVERLYVADGHHRCAAASRVAASRRAADVHGCANVAGGRAPGATNPDHTGEESYNYFLSVIFPDNQMQIMDYNRVVRDLNGLSREQFLERVGQAFSIDKSAHAVKPAGMGEFGMYLPGQWYRLRIRPQFIPANNPVAQLDVSLLANHLIAPILGITDARRDKRIDFVGGIRGLQELERRVNSGEMAVAIALFPTGMDQLMAVADTGEVMPPKSTWFEPKLADGLVSHVLD